MASVTSDSNPLNHVIHKIIVLATGIPGSESIRQYLETLYENNGDWSEVAVVIDNYLNGLLANESDGIPGMIQQLAENGFGATITLADAQALTTQFAEAGVSTWSGLFAWLYDNVDGDLATAWDNRADSASNFTATLNELGKNDDYNGKQVQAAAREWMEGVGVSDASVQAANEAATKLIERFLDGKVNGSAIDGYVAGATVYIAVNNNGEQDEGEPVTTTDANGNFTFDVDELPDGPLVGFGGTDLATGQPFEGEMTAPSGAAVLSPLTTLVQQMMTSNPGRSQAEVEDILFTTLDLPRVDLSSFDPIQSGLEEGSTRENQVVAARIQAVTSQLVNAMNVSKAVNSKVSADADGSKGFISALADRLDEAAGNGDIVRLDDEAELTEVVKKSVEKSGAINENSTAEERERADNLSGKAAAAIRDVNVKSREAVDELENNDDTDIVDTLSDVFKLQTLTQTEVAPSFLESEDDGLDDVVDRFSGDNLDNEVEDVQAGKLDEDTDTSTGNVTRPDDAPTPTTPTPVITLSEDTGRSDSDLITSNTELTLSNLIQPYNWEYSYDGGSHWSDGSGNKLYIKARDGENTVLVRQSDPSIGDQAVTSFTFTADRAKPGNVSLSLANDTGNGSDAITSDGTINVGNLEDDAQWQYRTGSSSEWVDGSGNQIDITDEGATTVSVRQTDVAGNHSSTIVLNLTLDTQAPEATSIRLAQDTGSSGSDLLTNVSTIVASNLESGATMEFSTDGSAWQAVGCGNGFTLSEEGEQTVYVRQTDRAGNQSASASLTVTVDKTAPEAPAVTLAEDSGVSASDFYTNNNQVNVAGIEDAATWEYSLDGSTWTAGSGSDFTLDNGDGGYQVQVRQTDSAGNTSQVGQIASMTLDTAKPSTPSLSFSDTGSNTSDALTNSNIVRVSGTELNSVIEYSLDGEQWLRVQPASYGRAIAMGNEVRLPSDGEHTVQVRETDQAGNVSDIASLTLTLDTAAPDALTLALASDTGASASDGVTSNSAINIDGLDRDNTWEYSLNGGSTWQDGCGSINISNDGTYDVRVRQTDAAGNVSSASSLDVTRDTASPVAPSLSLAENTGSTSDTLTSNGTVNVGAVESGASWEYSTNGSTWQAGSGSSFTLDEGDGTYTIQVRQTDIAGNLSSAGTLASVTLDTTSPSAPSVSLANDSGENASDLLTNNGTVNVSGLESAASWEYSTDGSTWTAGCGSSFTLSGDDEYHVQVRQTDSAGNVSDNASLNFSLDATAPDAPSLSLETDTGSSASDAISTEAAVQVSGIARGNTWEYSVDGGSNWQDGSGSGSGSVPEDGTYNVQVRQTDSAGNVSAIASLTLTRDTADPVAPSLSLSEDTGISASDALTNNGTVDVGALESGASWEYSLDGGSSWSTGSGNSFTASESGELSVRVRQTDVAGNTSTAGSLNYILDTEGPAAASLQLDQDSGTSASDSITNVGTVIVTNQESRATIEYSTDGSTWQTGCGNSFTLNHEGENTVRVRQVDEAGNTSTETSLAFTLDKTAGARPSVSLHNDSGNSSDGITTNGSVDISGIEDGATWEYKLSTASQWQSGSGNSIDFSSLNDGEYTVEVRQVDVAGNQSLTGSTYFEVDTVDPAAAPSGLVLASDSGVNGSDSVTNDRTINVQGLDENLGWEYKVGSDGDWQAGSGSSFETTGEDGGKLVYVRHVDGAGNTSSEASTSFTLDTTAPDQATSVWLQNDTGSSSSDGVTQSGNIRLTGTGDSQLYVQYSLDEGENWNYACTYACAGTWTGNVYVSGDGDKNVLIRQVDYAGNANEAVSVSLTIDTSAPSAPSLSLDSSEDYVQVSSLEENATWQYAFTASGAGGWTDGSGSSFQVSDAGEQDTVYIRQVDLAGNAGTAQSINMPVDTNVVPVDTDYKNYPGTAGNDQYIVEVATYGGFFVSFTIDGGAGEDEVVLDPYNATGGLSLQAPSSSFDNIEVISYEKLTNLSRVGVLVDWVEAITDSRNKLELVFSDSQTATTISNDLIQEYHWSTSQSSSTDVTLVGIVDESTSWTLYQALPV